METVKKWLLNILISLDQFGNTLLGGDPDETISSRIGKIKKDHNGSIPWDHPVVRCTDYILDCIDPNHSLDAIEPNAGSNAIIQHESEVRSDAEALSDEKGKE